MGNQHSTSGSAFRGRKNVHWKSAESPSPPGKPVAALGEGPEGKEGRLRWNPPKYDGGAPLQGYMVECNRLGSPVWVRTNPPLVLGPELILAGLESGYQYRFRVTAQNAVGVSAPGEVSDVLNVLSERTGLLAPAFQEGLCDTESLENDKTEFKVYFDGHPIPTVAWFKDGFEIFSSRRTAILTDSNCSTLIFHQTSLGDEGEIKCTITNRVGHAVSRSKLQLQAAPRVRLPRRYEDGLLFDAGESLQLKVSVVGKPSPDIEWKHDGRLISPSDRIQIVNGDKYSSLRIANASRDDRGEYQVNAVNLIGEDFASFLVTVTAKPDPPKNAKAIVSVERTAIVTWDPPDDDGGCQVGNYIVEYYRTGWNVWLKATAERKLAATLSDLIEGSEYRFRVKAESPYGMSEPSTETDSIFVPGKSISHSIMEEKKSEPDLPSPATVPRRKRQTTEEENGLLAKELAEEEPLAKYRNIDNFINNRTAESQSRAESPEVRREKVAEDKRKSFQLDLEDAMSPPVLSLSAPQLGSNLCLMQPLRYSVSSTELLHERAMSRVYQVLAMKEAESSKMKEPPKRIENEAPVAEPTESETRRSDESLSAAEQNSNFEDDYTTSTVSTGDSEYTDSDSLGEKRLRGESDERCTYHPKDMIPKAIPKDEPKTLIKVQLPDPNFVPKPILKKRPEPVTPEPQVKEEKPAKQSKPLLSKVPLLKRITKLGDDKNRKKKDEIVKNGKVAEPKMVAVEVKKEESVPNNVDISSIVAERYGSIVKEYGSGKKPLPVMFKNIDEMKKAAEQQGSDSKVVIKTVVKKKVVQNIQPVQQRQKPAPPPDKEKKKEKAVEKKRVVETVSLPKHFSELNAEAETNVKHAFNYIINIFMVMVAAWLYIFKSELLALPFLALAIYRELSGALKNRMPAWLTAQKAPT